MRSGVFFVLVTAGNQEIPTPDRVSGKRTFVPQPGKLLTVQAHGQKHGL